MTVTFLNKKSDLFGTVCKVKNMDFSFVSIVSHYIDTPKYMQRSEFLSGVTAISQRPLPLAQNQSHSGKVAVNAAWLT